MAEEPTTPKPKGNFLKGKIFGIPKPIVAIGAGVIAFVGYKYYKDKSTASSSSTATPTASTGTTGADDSGLDSGSGGGGSNPAPPNSPTPVSTGVDYGAFGTSTPNSPSGVPGAVPTTALKKPAITALGSKTIVLDGASYNTVSDFVDNKNGATYYGISNPAEAKRLTAAGATLVHNPNDPSGKGLFLMVPKGHGLDSTLHPAKNTAANRTAKAPVATGHLTATGADYTGTGSTGAVTQAKQTEDIKAAAQKTAEAKAKPKPKPKAAAKPKVKL